MGWLIRSVGSGLLKWIGFQIATLLGPLVIGVATAVLGRVGEAATWMWAVCAGSVAFGGAAAGVYYSIGIAEKFRVKGRLSFISPRIAHDLESGGVALGFNVQNQADVLLEYEIKQIRTQLGDNFPPSKPFSKMIYEVPAGGAGWFVDYVIPGSKPGDNSKIERGTVQVELLYGRPGARKHKLEAKWIVYLKYGEKSTIEHTAWEEAA